MARLAFRSEGKGFSGGLVDGDERRGFNFEVDHDYFERVVWPTVTAALESLIGLGIVRETTGRQRNRVFAYGRYIDLLTREVK